MAKYLCWGEDHEDLTEKVEEEAGIDPVVVFSALSLRTLSPGGKQPSPRKVLVTCSKGHENVFTVESS